MRRQSKWIVPMLLTGLALTGCGDSAPPQSAGHAGHNHPTASPSVPAAGNSEAEVIPATMKAFVDNGQVVEITISGNDRMQFDQTRLNVPKGAMVRLTLKHTGQLPAQSMGHNVVILVHGDDPFEFGADVNEQGGSPANQYVPSKLRHRTIAFTKLIGGGETAQVTFQAPEQVGEYPFLCSFPGHAGMMNGIVEVR